MKLNKQLFQTRQEQPKILEFGKTSRRPMPRGAMNAKKFNKRGVYLLSKGHKYTSAITEEAVFSYFIVIMIT